MAAQVQRVDLRQWGYSPPGESGVFLWSRIEQGQTISIGSKGDVFVGFVTRDRTGLVTRQLPAFSFHVLKLSKDGALISEQAFPTASWDHNAVFSGIDENLLIRTGDKLRLFSPEFEQLAERNFPMTPEGKEFYWRIFPLQDRKAFILYRVDTYTHNAQRNAVIELIGWRDFKPLAECEIDRYRQPLSASERNLLTFQNGGLGQAMRRRVFVDQICGPPEFSYTWEAGPTSASLVSNDGIFITGGDETVTYVSQNAVKWKDAFKKNSETVNQRVEVDESGHLGAVAVLKWGGGSEFLDIDRKLKAVKVVVYEVSTGKRVREILVQPLPSVQFDLAISPDGKTLATIADGFLEITPLAKSIATEPSAH